MLCETILERSNFTKFRELVRQKNYESVTKRLIGDSDAEQLRHAYEKLEIQYRKEQDLN